MSKHVSLREYFEKLRKVDQRAISAALAAAEKAVTKAEEAQQLKNEQSNEWRQAMLDANARYASTEGMAALDARVAGLEKALAASGGQARGIGLVWGGAVAIVMAGLAMAALIFR